LHLSCSLAIGTFIAYIAFNRPNKLYKFFSKEIQMKRLISPLLVAVVAVMSYAQVDQSTMTYDQLFLKMSSDKVLGEIYRSALQDIAKNIELAAKTKELTDPINAQWTSELTKIADSLGVKITDASGTPEHYKLYNFNADTTAVKIFLALRTAIDNKYQPLITSSTAELQTQYYQMVQDAFTEAANRYYQNRNKMTN
jgi:hypothetical protein